VVVSPLALVSSVGFGLALLLCWLPLLFDAELDVSSFFLVSR